jgi:predicted AlkP superfamily pyrophosphatase or phosphodiesterase
MSGGPPPRTEESPLFGGSASDGAPGQMLRRPFLTTGLGRAAAIFATLAAVTIVLVLVAVHPPPRGSGTGGGGGGTGGPVVSCADRRGAGGPATVVLVSIDGFRYAYLARGVTPALQRMAERGATGGMRPSFPSKTFPNHYTLVTGLYPSAHGIVANSMLDLSNGWTFSISNETAVHEPFWWLGTPLWVSAVEQGIGSATYFWPGSETRIHGVLPNITERFDMSVPYADRVDTILGWLRTGSERFVTLYMSAVDTAGHNFGPDAPQVDEALRIVDAAIARLVDGIAAAGLDDCVNVVVVSDHGMAEVDPGRGVYLDDHIDLSRVEIIDYSPVLQLRVLDAAGEIDIDGGEQGEVDTADDGGGSGNHRDLDRVTPSDAGDEAASAVLVQSRVRSRRRAVQGHRGGVQQEAVRQHTAQHNAARRRRRAARRATDPLRAASAVVEAEIVANLTGVVGIQQAWLKPDAPERFHYRDSDRIMPVVALADEGYTITTRARGAPRPGGAHGFDPSLDSMRALFVAAGPNITNIKDPIAAFTNVDLYPAICRILGLAPAPNNGTAVLSNQIVKQL